MNDLEKKVEETGNKDYKPLSEAERKSASSQIYNELMIASHYTETSQQSIAPPAPPDSLPPPPSYAPIAEAPNLESIAESPETTYATATERAPEKQASDEEKKKKVLLLSTAATIIFIAILGLLFTTPGALTGYTITNREVQQTIDFNQDFSQYTETQLDLGTITGLKISGKLEGTEARVILRINGTDYLVVDIVNPNIENLTTGTEQPTAETPQYTITTDKSSYLLGETVTITVTPETETSSQAAVPEKTSFSDNKSLYVAYGEQTQILETNTYVTQELGEHQAIALITLPDDILRIETNFTVINETVNETAPIETETPTPAPEPAPPEQASAYEFSGLCTETCNIPESSSAILIIETSENSTLTITQITTTQNKENQAPEQIRVISDITQTTQQTTTLDLNEYFSDPDNDTVQYDINEIPEIDATISQNILTIASATPGVYTAYIYATDGDKLVTSNTFTITITETGTGEAEGEINLTNETNQTIQEIPFTDCNDPNPNLRPPECITGNEDQYFKNTPIFVQNLDRSIVARVTAFGNLIIKGKLVENSQDQPGSRDFKISYFINDGETEVTTAWIDTETGDLNLRGELFEEQFSILPTTQDAFLIQNKKGTNLGYFDRQTGNLYLRGNLIQERPEQDITE